MELYNNTEIRNNDLTMMKRYEAFYNLLKAAPPLLLCLV